MSGGGELCGVCGASWECEHLKKPRMVARVPDPHGPDVMVVKQTAEEIRLRVAEYLRDVADNVEAGIYPTDHTRRFDAEALIIVLSSAEDVHVPLWCFYRDAERFTHARHASDHAAWNHGTPEELAANRAALAARREEERLKYIHDHPYGCTCNDRFKTEAGRRQHWRAMERRKWESGKHEPKED